MEGVTLPSFVLGGRLNIVMSIDEAGRISWVSDIGGEDNRVTVPCNNLRVEIMRLKSLLKPLSRTQHCFLILWVGGDAGKG